MHVYLAAMEAVLVSVPVPVGDVVPVEDGVTLGVGGAGAPMMVWGTRWHDAQRRISSLGVACHQYKAPLRGLPQHVGLGARRAPNSRDTRPRCVNAPAS
jgi:hypothetical protein